MNTHEKAKISLRYFLIGKGWFKAVEILNYAEKQHDGFRKDGVTPEFAHQIWIANYVRTLPLPDDIMCLAISLALLHDTAEDKDYGFHEFSIWGDDIVRGVKLLTKKHRGTTVAKDTYFSELATMAAAVLVKGIDRLHNLSTMPGVFKREKQYLYITETKDHHLPMLKQGKRNFPQYEAAFENIKQSLLSRIELISLILENNNESSS
jgi:(p)ppGpp synthase/HD superfamily hydrolase